MGKLAVIGSTGRKVARPVKTLIPLIQEALVEGNRAGLEYYREAGELLLEVRNSGQVRPGAWTRWLKDNFELSSRTAQRYMEYARVDDDYDENDVESIEEFENVAGADNLTKAIGEKHSVGAKHKASKYKPLMDAVDKIDAKRLADERHNRDTEIKLHRELALQLIELGYRALATRLHPDQRGGSKEAMSRLNTVRHELKDIAATRRFV